MRCRVRLFQNSLKALLPFFLLLIYQEMSWAQSTEAACRSVGGTPQYRKDSTGKKFYSECLRFNERDKGYNVDSMNSKCLKQLSAMGGGKGCYEVVGNSCSFGFDKCKTAGLCSNNGGKWQNGSCVDKNSVAQSTTPEKSRTEKCLALGGAQFDSQSELCKCPDGSKKTSINELGSEKCEPKSETTAEVKPQDNQNAKACNDADGMWRVWAADGDSQAKCFCGGSSEERGTVLSNPSATNKCPTSQAATRSESTEECTEFARYEEKVKQCESESAAAVKSCDAESKNANSGYDDAKAAAAILGQVQMARGQQQGSVEACMRAGVMANTMFYGLDLMKNDCNPGMEQCKSSCNAAKEFENISDKCYAEFIQKYGAYTQGADPAMDQKYSQFMSGVGQKMQSLQARLQAGAEKCDVEAPSKAAELNRLMKDMNNSAVQAQKCQCQQTAGQANCDDIMGPEFCLKNPTDPRCPRTVAVCSPSSADYNTKTCLCMRDPKNSQCAVITGGAGGPAALAGGPGYNPIGTSGGNYSGKTGGSGGINLNGGLGDDAVAVSSDHSGGGPGEVFGVAGTGSAGGGSTPSGEDGSGAGAGEGEDQTKSGVAGLFNALKTGMGNLLGGGSGNKAGGSGKTFGDGSKNNGNAVDPNKWRPRGVAAVGQIGGRNENIFQKISDQYGMQSHTFMSGAK